MDPDPGSRTYNKYKKTKTNQQILTLFFQNFNFFSEGDIFFLFLASWDLQYCTLILRRCRIRTRDRCHSRKIKRLRPGTRPWFKSIMYCQERRTHTQLQSTIVNLRTQEFQNWNKKNICSIIKRDSCTGKFICDQTMGKKHSSFSGLKTWALGSVSLPNVHCPMFGF